MATAPALGTPEYTNWLIQQGAGLGMNLSQYTVPTGTNAVNTSYLQPTTSTAPLGSTQRTNDLLAEASSVTGISAPTFTQETMVPSAISPQNLAPVSPINAISPQNVPAYNVSGLEVPQLSATPQENKAGALTDMLMGLNDSTVGKSAYQSEQDTKFGVDAAQASIQDLSAQLTGLKNEAAAIPLQLQQGASDRGVTTTQLGRQENSRLRTNAIAALGVSTLLAASQGQLANAQAMADKAVAQKYDPIYEQINAAKANLDLIMNDPRTTLQDKNRALAQQAIQDQKEQQTNLQVQNAKEVWNIATTAASNGQNFTPTGQYTTLAQTLQAISAAPTKEGALQIASITGLIAPTGGTSEKILGNSTTGYYTYDPVTGQTSPIASPYGSTSGGTTGTTGTTGGTTSTAPKLTATQLNTGSSLLGVTADQYKSLDPQVQTFFVGTGGKAFMGAINDVISGQSTDEDVMQAIQSSIQPQVVKDYMHQLLNRVAKPTAYDPASEPKTNFFQDVWSGLTSLFK